MKRQGESFFGRMWCRVFPRVPDFEGRIAARCQLLEAVLGELDAFLAEGSSGHAQAVRDGVERAHAQTRQDLDRLHRTFVTRIDREDIDMLLNRVDHVFDYAASAVWELELLGITTDRWMIDMAAVLREGAAALSEGFALFRERPEQAEPFAAQVRRAERKVESIYREVLAAMFSTESVADELDLGDESGVVIALVFDRMKRREIYRHLSNAADRLAHVGDALHDLSVKYA